MRKSTLPLVFGLLLVTLGGCTFFQGIWDGITGKKTEPADPKGAPLTPTEKSEYDFGKVLGTLLITTGLRVTAGAIATAYPPAGPIATFLFGNSGLALNPPVSSGIGSSPPTPKT